MFLTIQKKRASQVVLSNKVSPTSTNHVWEIRNLLVETKLLTEQEIMRIDTLVTSMSEVLFHESIKAYMASEDSKYERMLPITLSAYDTYPDLPNTLMDQSLQGLDPDLIEAMEERIIWTKEFTRVQLLYPSTLEERLEFLGRRWETEFGLERILGDVHDFCDTVIQADLPDPEFPIKEKPQQCCDSTELDSPPAQKNLEEMFNSLKC